MKILLEGGRNFWQIRDLMGQLNENMTIIEDSAKQSDKGATIVKEVMSHLELLFTASIETNEKTKKTKQSRKKNNEQVDSGAQS